MFDRSATYQKSAKGAEAIATRSAALGPKLRSVLILVDGKKGFDELAKLGQMFGDPAELLSQLERGGYIEPAQAAGAKGASAGAAPGAAPGAPEAPAVAAASAATVPLPQAKRFAVRKLTDLLGPAAEDLCLRIEGTRNAQEFAAAVHRAEGMLRQIRGEKTAAQFAAEVAANRPA